MQLGRDQRLRLLIGTFGLLLLPMLLAISPAHAGELAERSTVQRMVEALRPGEFLWAPQVSPVGPMLLVVNLRTQRAALYRNGIPIGISTVSTGRRGHETPAGIYAVLQKKVSHRSSLYDDAPMPFMQRLTWDGVALHGGIVPGYPASHGCIRLPPAFAKLIFRETRIGMLVVVTRLATMPTMALTGAAPLMARSGEGLKMQWTNVIGVSPLSIVVSTTDQEVRVIRRGREIGAARAIIHMDIRTPIVYQLQSKGTWLRVPLPGQDAKTQQAIDANDIEVESLFRERVLAASAPGTTIVITPDHLRPILSTAQALTQSDHAPN